MSFIRITRGVPRYNIQIGPISDALSINPNLIVSVTDYYETKVAHSPGFHWIPINELAKPWGYSPFFTFKRILDFWTDPVFGCNPIIFVGCSAGVHRSPLSVFCWLLSLGYTPEQAAAEFYGKFKQDPLTLFNNDIRTGYLPSELPAFYRLMNENPSWSYMGTLQAMLKYEKIQYTPAESIKNMRYDSEEGLIIER